ncbi:MAG: right-handed parallel beta-helix repeat-containing protein [Planctomycetes bacterium]|nr:right-handed parallel beta-helix repeat-containing protein [Planctomycetota bacterium]
MQTGLGMSILAVIFLAVGAAPGQTTWYVDDDAPNDPGPGDPTVSDPDEDGSADHPFDAIQEGINAAPGVGVTVSEGAYTWVDGQKSKLSRADQPCVGYWPYLLITNEALADAFQPLVDRRTAQRLFGTLVTVETIYATYSGADEQEKIRNCVKDYHANHGTIYVALGGDDGTATEPIVPVRYCAPTDPDTLVPADLYYADVDGGNWDTDGDGIYGEVGDVGLTELTPDVHLGRIPVRTADDAAAYISKLVTYETMSPDGFANSIMFICGAPRDWATLYSGNARPTYMRDHDPLDGGDKGYWDWYRNEIQPYWQATPLCRFHGTITSWDTAVCGDYELNASNLVDRLSEGYHHVVFSGHGSATSWQIEVDNFTAAHATQLTNAARPSIVRSGGCGVAWFDMTPEPGLGEVFLRNPSGGAVVFFGYARAVSDGRLQDQLHREIFQNGHHCVGEAFTECKRALAHKYVAAPYHQYIYVLLGDPAIVLLDEESGRILQLAAPNGCEIIDVDDGIFITWNASGTGFAAEEKVRLEYSDDGGGSWYPIPGAEGLPYNGCEFRWTQPSLALGSHYRMRVTSITDPSAIDASDRDFSIADLGLLTVQSVPVTGLFIDGTHYNRTNYTYSAAVGHAVELIAPTLPDQNFVRWAGADGATLTECMTYGFTLEGDTIVVAEYQEPGPPRDYYVNDEVPEDNWGTGDDANDGLTSQTPMRHVQAVLDRYADIQTIYMAPGIYSEHVEIAALDDGLALVGTGPSLTILDGQHNGRCLSLDSLTYAHIEGLTIRNGLATVGAAVHSEFATWTMADCILEENGATGVGGGGMYLVASFAQLTNCALEHNTSALLGGAIISAIGTIEITGCTFQANSAGGAYGLGGGAVCLLGDSSRIENCVFAANTAATGGAVCIDQASTNIVSCTFQANCADVSGGAVALTDHTQAIVANCTFADNAADTGGSAMLVSYGTGATAANCIFWDNDAPNNEQIGVRGPSPTSLAINYCDVQGGQAGIGIDPDAALDWGVGNSDEDPLFADPDGPDNDPDTWEDNDYHLSADSPCIDKGDPDFVPQPGETDMDGEYRLWDGDDVPGARVDMGADEFGSYRYGDLNCDGIINGFDIDAFVAALKGPPYYDPVYPDCDLVLADINADGVVNGFDIDPFIALLIGG